MLFSLVFCESLSWLIITYEFLSSFQAGTSIFYRPTALTAESSTAVRSSSFSTSLSSFSFCAWMPSLTLCCAFIWAKKPSSALISLSCYSKSIMDSTSFLRIAGLFSAYWTHTAILFFNVWVTVSWGWSPSTLLLIMNMLLPTYFILPASLSSRGFKALSSSSGLVCTCLLWLSCMFWW